MSKEERGILTVCTTLMLCLAFGIALHSWAGICIGLCMGMAFGLFGSEGEDDDDGHVSDRHQ